MGKTSTDQAARTRFRNKLRKWGMSEEDIALCDDQVRQRQREKKFGQLPIDAPLCTLGVYVRYLRRQPHANASGAEVLSYGEDYEQPSDKGFRPAKVDSILNGVGRAIGQTAKAVKRGKTVTKYQHDGGE